MTLLNSFFLSNEPYPDVHAIEVRTCTHELIHKYTGIGYVTFDNEEEGNEKRKRLR